MDWYNGYYIEGTLMVRMESYNLDFGVSFKCGKSHDMISTTIYLNKDKVKRKYKLSGVQWYNQCLNTFKQNVGVCVTVFLFYNHVYI